MTSHRLKIGVDIDGVLIDMDPKEYLEFCAKEFGWNTSYEIFQQTHSWAQATGQVDEEIVSRGFEHFLASVEDAEYPIEGAHNALRKLGTIADIYLITARSDSTLEKTESFLRKHLPDVQYIEISMGNAENKLQPVVDFTLDYFIDDSYRQMSLLVKNKDIATKLIPFPSFHSTNRWSELEDERLIWLKAWDEVRENVSVETRKEIYKHAWEEIEVIITNSTT